MDASTKKSLKTLCWFFIFSPALAMASSRQAGTPLWLIRGSLVLLAIGVIGLILVSRAKTDDETDT